MTLDRVDVAGELHVHIAHLHHQKISIIEAHSVLGTLRWKCERHALRYFAFVPLDDFL